MGLLWGISSEVLFCWRFLHGDGCLQILDEIYTVL